MPRFSLCLALALALATPATAQVTEEDVCEVAGDLMHIAVTQREGGATQRQAARYIAAGSGEAASNQSGSRADRQHVANLLGGMATTLLRIAYSLDLDPRIDNAQVAARTVYAMCLKGEL